MRNTVKSYLLLLALICLYPVTGTGQSLDYASSKEKVYIQTSHVYFKPGETMYFKVYVVKANTQTPSFLSTAVYTEIIGPSGNVVQKLNYGVENGYAEGSFSFDEQAPGGVYKIRAFTTWMRNEEEHTFFVKEITLLKVITPRLLMKLDFPEKGYGGGDEVKADFSMRNLNDQPVRNYPATYKVSIDGAIVQTNTFTTDDEGKAQLRFFLPGTLNTTDGLLNITIQYDSYTEAISRSIPIVLNKIDLQFMPEGGTLVQEIPSQIAFKAVNEHGKPVDVKGEVLDSRGNKVASFDSYRFGMGKFLFTPQKGQTYTAKIITPANVSQQFALPQASVKGIVMNISNASNQLVAKLTTTDKREVTLVGQTKNTTWFTKKIVLQRGENSVAIDDSKPPAGITQFTLYTNDLPVAERLIFLNENKNLQVSITTSKPKYLPREKVSLTIKTLDEKGNPVPSNLSLAVLDDKLWSFADDKQDHILSWLLMSSELKGKIEEPAFYFKKDEPKALPALDLVMLTHGYRYFDYIESVEKQGALSYMPDEQNIVSGTIVNAQKQPVKGSVFLVHAVTGGKAIQYNTTEDGLFFFSQLTPNSIYYLFAHAANKTEKVTIQVTQNGLGYNPLKNREHALLASLKKGWQMEVPMAGVALPDQAPAMAREMKIENSVGYFDKSKVNRLEDVVVIGFGAARKQHLTGSVATIKGNEISQVNIATALQGRVAGLYITKQANPMDAEKVMIRGARSLASNIDPLIVLDGVPMELYRLNALNAGDIESVTVMKDAAATALYGSRAAYGVIIVETKKFRTGSIRFTFPDKYHYASQSVKTANGPVFSVARRFYAPKYYSTEPQERTDFRETIFWNPVIQTDKQGTATVEFYNSDASTTFRAIAEGIGYNGKAGRTEYTYITQNAMTVDAKIPPCLTVGDYALLPLVIKNNHIQDLQVRVKISLPLTMQSVFLPTSLLLPADSSQQLLIPVKAIAPTNGNIQFIVETDLKTETIKLPITAVEKGFPVIETFSGNRNGKHEFTISKVMPGSLRTNLKLFKNLEGQLLDGIESMLREPYGCFEQTSSCTYPNIYILKYLRESGRSNPDIEKKALGYIERGYKRLIGFETKKNGFEWFGNTPPHEALTAYGLLEFTDMQEFIQVDKRMLERTKQFLLDRRDGNGSFNLASGGYDRFASVPNKIAHIYIVYALTQAGIGKEIEREYAAAVKKALESNDGYLLAMMALAASNMKQENDFRLLMNALNARSQKSNLSSETSVVNSRDASLRVETASLYALALMRESSADLNAVANLISRILAEKSYYGYGSTQATVLALQAIVTYAKLSGRMAENPQITFTMNDTMAVAESDLSATVHEGRNVFAVQYGSRNAIPYNLEVAYNTFTPPNSPKAELTLATRLADSLTRVGETVRMDIEVANEKSVLQPMAIAKIGIPAGLALQPWQLKELKETNQVAYYEIFDNYLVLYWMGFAGNETKKIKLDLKAEIAGSYKGKASNTYLYYTPEYKNWNDGVEVTIEAHD
ncbi:TonB-dependent receptor plug domain-containing protein [Niastella caeni]|nr:TonB-dependent receptor plug domain-containing protein [Niastella caeni]